MERKERNKIKLKLFTKSTLCHVLRKANQWFCLYRVCLFEPNIEDELHFMLTCPMYDVP